MGTGRPCAVRGVPLLPACRRLLDRHPGCGPLWSGGGPHPHRRGRRARGGGALRGDALESDRTSDLLREDLAGVRRAVRHGGVGDVASADVVVVEVDAIGPGGMVLDADDVGVMEAARATEVPVWVEAGVGRRCHPAGLEALVAVSRPRTSPGRDALRPRGDLPGGGADRGETACPSPSPAPTVPSPENCWRTGSGGGSRRSPSVMDRVPSMGEIDELSEQRLRGQRLSATPAVGRGPGRGRDPGVVGSGAPHQGRLRPLRRRRLRRPRPRPLPRRLVTTPSPTRPAS